MKLAPVQQNRVLIPAQPKCEAMMMKVSRAPQIFKPRRGIAIRHNGMIARECQSIAHFDLPQCPSTFVHSGGGQMNRAMRSSVAVVVKNQRSLVSPPIRVRKYVFIYSSVVRPEIVEHKVSTLSKELS